MQCVEALSLFINQCGEAITKIDDLYPVVRTSSEYTTYTFVVVSESGSFDKVEFISKNSYVLLFII